MDRGIRAGRSRGLSAGARVLCALALAMPVGLSIASSAAGANTVLEQQPSCAQEPKVKSLRGDTPAMLRFVNNTSQPLQTFWINYDGKRVFYETVKPFGSYVQRTWVTHPWVVADSAGRCITLYVMADTTATVTINEPGASVASPTSTQTSSPATTAGTLLASATRVSCNRDTAETTVALLRCTALVGDASGRAGGSKPTGKVAWTATVGSFSGSGTCLLTAADTGVSSCTVEYRAASSDVPIGVAPPVTASYAGDRIFAPSSGTTVVGGGIVDGDAPTGVPMGVILGALAGLAAAAIAGLALTGHLGGSIRSAGPRAAPTRPPAPRPTPSAAPPAAGPSSEEMEWLKAANTTLGPAQPAIEWDAARQQFFATVDGQQLDLASLSDVRAALAAVGNPPPGSPLWTSTYNSFFDARIESATSAGPPAAAAGPSSEEMEWLKAANTTLGPAQPAIEWDAARQQFFATVDGQQLDLASLSDVRAALAAVGNPPPGSPLWTSTYNSFFDARIESATSAGGAHAGGGQSPGT